MVRMAGAVVGLAVVLVAGDASGAPRPGKFLPVSLKCPAENGGVLELVLADVGHRRARLRVAYDGEKAKTLISATAEPSLDYVESEVMHLERKPKPVLEGFVKNSVELTNSVLQGVCLTSAPLRAAYFETLAANRRILALP